MNEIEVDDRTLVARFLRDGDERTFRMLYRRHVPALYRFALRMLDGVEDDALDCVQDGWVRAVEALQGFEWRSSLRTWLIAIVRNRCRECHRARRRGPWSSVDLDLATAPPVHRPVARIDLEAAIAALPPGYREVLLLHDVEQCTHREIADLLGIRPGTSKSQLSRARNAVRAHLREGGEARDRSSAVAGTTGERQPEEQPGATPAPGPGGTPAAKESS